jgi:hypothetical protein
MRPVLWVICATLLLGMAYHALAAPQPYSERPSFRPQIAKEAKQAVPACIRHRVLILAQRLPNGKTIPVMVAVVAVPC